MSSKTTVFSAMVSALVKAEDILGPNRVWTPVTREQKDFLDRYFTLREEVTSAFSSEELHSLASYSTEELNRWLTQEGFNVQLQEFDEEEFGIVSMLDVLVNWLRSGETHTLPTDRGMFPAVRMKDGWRDESGQWIDAFVIHESPTYAHPVAKVFTQTGDAVYMTIADKEREGFSLLEKIESIKSELNPSRDDIEALIFPMIDLNQEVDISWFRYMWTTGEDGFAGIIGQALQQTKFKMNQHGARAKSAVAFSVSRGISLPPIIMIDRPFFLWIERPGLSMPLFAAYLSEEVWKDPGNLSL